VDGVIVVDKEEGWTSHDVVSKMRRIANTKRIGHLGTLDPIATGVLPLVIGRATRLAQFYTRSDKIYEALIRFGFATDTYDRAGAHIPGNRAAHRRRRSGTAARRFSRRNHAGAAPRVGQEGGWRARLRFSPPANTRGPAAGARAHPRLTLLEVRGAEARLRAHCSGGTYMRSIAHDLGQALGCGAHLRDLRRMASAEFTLEQAHTIPHAPGMAAERPPGRSLIPAAHMLPDFPVYVDSLTAGQIRQGATSRFRRSAYSGYTICESRCRDGELIAIGEAVLPNLYHPAVVL
jgi:tRNA pseudouridine55 synthase